MAEELTNVNPILDEYRHRLIMSAPHLKEASGEIATFDSDMIGKLKECKVSFEPVQDLHGYDHPWPGGGNTNKFDGLWNGASENFNYATNYIPVTEGETYFVFTPNLTTDYLYVDWCDAEKTRLSQIYARNSIITAPTGAAFARLKLWYSFDTNDIAFNYPSTVHTYSPYSNICPITGWDGVQVWDDPKYGGTIWWNQIQAANINSKNVVQGILRTASDDKTKLRISGTCEKTDNYTVSFPDRGINGHKYLLTLGNVELPSGARILLGANDKVTANICEKTASASIQVNVTIKKDVVIDVTVTPQCFDLTKMFGEAKADEIYAMEQANAGSGVAYFRSLFPADYYPYNTGEITTVSAVNGDPYRHYSITFPTEAGTVYGGTLDMASGKLVVDRASVDFAGMNWSRDTTENPNGTAYTVSTTVPFIGWGNGGNKFAVSNVFNKASLAGSQGTEKNNTFWWNTARTGYRVVWGKPNKGSSIEDFNAFLSNNNVNVIGKLATPITYQLTPTQVKTLLGQNNIWADIGDVDVKYWSH